MANYRLCIKTNYSTAFQQQSKAFFDTLSEKGIVFNNGQTELSDEQVLFVYDTATINHLQINLIKI